MEFYKETKLQKTEIGEIPKEWKEFKLIDIGNLTDGDWILKKYYDENGVRLLQVGDIGIGKFINKSQRFISRNTTSKLNCTFIKPNKDILISRMPDPIGRACIAPDLPYPYIGAVDITIFTLNDKIASKEFVCYALNYHKTLEQCKNQAGGATRSRISRKNLENIIIAVPNAIEEQRQIASILSRVDDAIQKTDQIIQKTQLLKKGLMQELLTKGIGHKEFKYSEDLGCEIPKEWDVVKIEDIIPDKKGAIKIGPFGSQLKKNEMVSDGIKVYGQENVLGKDFKIGNRYISEKKFKTLQSVEIFPGDVLISMMGSVGYSAVFPEGAERGIMDSHLIRIQVIKDKCLPLFLSRLINDALIIKNQIMSMSQGAIMSGLNSQIIRRIVLPLPETKEQCQIASILSKVDDQIEKERQTKEQLERLKKGLMQILLTGKVRVKVN